MADFRINTSTPTLPIAQPQPNMIDALSGGLQTGVGLGFAVRKMAIEQQEAEAKRQKDEADRFAKGVELLTNKAIAKNLSKETRKELLTQSILPGLSRNYGIDIDPSGIEVTDDDDDGAIGRIVNLVKLGAPKELINREYQLALLQSDSESLPVLKEFGQTIKPSGMSEYQQAMLALRREQMNDKTSERIGKKEEAQNRVSQNLETMASLYRDLSDEGGIVDITKSGIANIPRRISSSGIGQATGRALGTKEQSIRNRINQIRPLLINDIRQASQMGARGLDSEKELEFYLQAATDPSKDIQANLEALGVLDRAYGLGLGVSGTGAGTTTFIDSDGETHTIPTANLGAAKKRDPGLKVIK